MEPLNLNLAVLSAIQRFAWVPLSMRLLGIGLFLAITMLLVCEVWIEHGAIHEEIEFMVQRIEHQVQQRLEQQSAVTGD